MSSTCLFLALALCVLILTTTAAPCDSNDPDELCLAPLVRKRGSFGVVSRKRGGRGGGRRPGRRPSRIPIIAGGAVGGSRRPNNNNDDPNQTDEFNPDEQNEEACFPGNAMVHVEERGLVPMEELVIGDRVQVGHGDFSEVFIFGHKMAGRQFKFVRLITEHGDITLSKGHYIYSDGQLKAAGVVSVGSVLETADGVRSAVIAVEGVSAAGLYNPHTLTGDIVVDGFRASTFTMSVELSVANSLLAPVRAAFRLLGVDISAQCLENGAPTGLLRRIPGGSSVATS